ncbi:retrovirus-related pol polyprotein from transposon TNT 1-94 [Tanacetum coccineum]|uniref:Retrovirus-related pol polyprotein from transposon TNT 1-94 n=1 Tax=Tanacetum coccineum TaxID=301880 RepID=A0ABQ5A8K8_9ASTR
MSQEKEAQIKFYKTREDNEIDKVIALENKVKVLDDIVYKIGQSVQTMNMLNRNCKMSFAKPEFLKKAQRANPRLYDIGFYNNNLALMLAPEFDETIRLAKESRSKLSDLIRPFDYDQLNNLYDLEYYYADHLNAILGVYTKMDKLTNLQCDYLEDLEKCERLEKELSNSKTMSKSFEALQKHAINLKLALQQSQLQDKGIAISELKKLLEKMKGKSVVTKFEKSLVIRQPNVFKSQRQSILGKPSTFSDSLAKTDFSNSKSITTNNVSNDFLKLVTAQILPQNVVSISKNTNVIAPGMYKVHTKTNQTRTPQFPRDIRKTNKRVSFSTGEIPTTCVSRPHLKSNQLEDKVMPNNSQGKKQEVEEHRRNFKFSNNKMSVTACNDSLNAKTSNVNFVCVTCGKCVLNENHDMCVLHYINGINFRTKMPMAVPINTREHKRTVNQSVATPFKRILVEIILFIIESGCSKHMTGNLKLLTNFVEKFLAWLWHRCLSHLKFDTINLLSNNDIMIGLPKLKFIKDHLCSPCELGKAKRKSFHTKTTPSSKRRLQLLHMDLCGPMRVESINGKKYVLVIVDDYSGYTWTHFLRAKYETPEVLIDFLKLVQRGLHAQVRTVQNNKGTEFLNKTLHAYFAQERIEHQTSTAQTLNKMALSKDGTILLLRLLEQWYSTQSRAYRVYNKRTRVIVETIHVNLDELPQMASDHISSDPVPQSETVTTSNELDLLFSLMFNELLYGTTQVVSKSSAITTTVTPNKRQQQQHTTPSTSTTVAADTPPLNIQTTPDTTRQAPTQAPTVTATENINQAKTNKENVHVEEDKFINIFSTPVQEQGETSSRHVDSLNMYTFYQRHPSKHRSTKDHPLEQVIGNPSQSIRIRRRLETDGEICMFALSYLRDTAPVSTTAFFSIRITRVVSKEKNSIPLNSTSGGIQIPRWNKLVSWSSKKQDCTSMSSVKPKKYVSFICVLAQVLWLRTQLTDYGFHFDKIPMYCHSKAAIAISCNPVQHSPTKHIDVRYHFIKEQVEKGIVKLFFVRTEHVY